MPAYPNRPKFFAHRHFRSMVKSCAAQDIGPTAMLLCAVVAAQEDAKRYRGAVTYFNDQLAPLVGVSGRSALMRAREKAVKAGWLHYEPGGKGVPGRYWVLTPPHAVGLDDSPTDETDAAMELGLVCSHESGQENDEQSPTVSFPVTNREGKEEFGAPNREGKSTEADLAPHIGRETGLQRDCKRSGNGSASAHHSTLTLSLCPRPKKKRARKFAKPSVADVSEYCQQRSNNVDPQAFVDHYESNGWKVGRNPMKDWKAAVRTWERNGVNKKRGQQNFEGLREFVADEPV